MAAYRLTLSARLDPDDGWVCGVWPCRVGVRVGFGVRMGSESMRGRRDVSFWKEIGKVNVRHGESMSGSGKKRGIFQPLLRLE